MKAVLAAIVLIPAISLPALADAPKKKKQPALKPASLVVPSSSAGSSAKPAQIQAAPKPVPAPLYREDVTLEEMHRYHQ
jgi:hypothetical protein